MADNPYRNLPAVHEVLDTQAVRDMDGRYAREAIVALIRIELDEARRRIQQGGSENGSLDVNHVAARVVERLGQDHQPKLRPVINATGIVLHTNLGRAPMAAEAARAAFEASQGYLNLELDLETGKRSSRQDAVREWICRLTGAEAATAVNNNAAATVIALRALCQGKEVIISRGQLIEIGGSFRIPEIMGVSGALLREVGTTNITRLADFERAIGPNTAGFMNVHTSNYRISGFTKAVSLDDLVALGKKHNLKVIDDIGSGAMVDFARFGFQDEPVARSSIAAGADLVLFSGDKLLGGPQAGVLAGKKQWIQAIEKDPLMRAFRLDKMTLAALEATLRIYLNEAKALSAIPVLNMLGVSLDRLREKADGLAARLRDIAGVTHIEVCEDQAYVGGGSLPDQAMKTWVVQLEAAGLSDAEFACRLRTGQPAVLGRVRDGRLVLDVRTVFDGQLDALVAAVAAAVAH